MKHHHHHHPLMILSNNGDYIAIAQSSSITVYHTKTHQFFTLNCSRDSNSNNIDETSLRIIRSLTFDNRCRYIASVGDDKIVNIHSISSGELVKQCKLPKKCTSVLSTTLLNECEVLIVSDRSGIINVIDWPNNTMNNNNDDDDDNENTQSSIDCDTLTIEYRQLLAHCATVITSMTMSDNQRYLISADYDSKIRVSNIPNTFDIQTFCLGLKTPVIEVIALLDDIFVSSSLDGCLYVWNATSGVILNIMNINDYESICGANVSSHHNATSISRVNSMSFNAIHKLFVCAISNQYQCCLAVWSFDVTTNSLHLRGVIATSEALISIGCSTQYNTSTPILYAIDSQGIFRKWCFDVNSKSFETFLQIDNDSNEHFTKLIERLRFNASKQSTQNIKSLIDEISDSIDSNLSSTYCDTLTNTKRRKIHSSLSSE